MLTNHQTDLADKVSMLYAEAERASLTAGKQYLATGQALVEAKADCGHGNWLSFLERAGIAERQAQRLMRLVNAGIKSDTVSDIGLNGSLTLAAKRTLPDSGEVLAVTVPGADSDTDATVALAWPADRPANHFNVLGIAPECRELMTFGQPVNGDNVFMVMDAMLGRNQARQTYQLLNDEPDESSDIIRMFDSLIDQHSKCGRPGHRKVQADRIGNRRRPFLIINDQNF